MQMEQWIQCREGSQRNTWSLVLAAHYERAPLKCRQLEQQSEVSYRSLSPSKM